MVKSKKTEASNSNRESPDMLERKRLKKLAITNNIVSDTQVKAPYSLNPSKTVVKHHGKDIIRKSQRKNRFLFSFPGLLAPVNGGGKIGELKDLSSKNPVLYLDFPQGRMKLFGTIVYPKNRYLTLQFSRSGKNVMCEDNFDHMIVFSEAWWIGTKEENPEELKVDFPKELYEGKVVECDFKGGAGAGSVNKQVHKSGGTKCVKEESPETELDDYSSDDNNDLKDVKGVTPIRQSARTAGKTFKFAEVSPGDDSPETSPDILEEEDEEEEKKVKTNMSSAVALGIESESSREGKHLSEQIQTSAISVTKSKKSSKSAASVPIPKENSHNDHGSLVQSTISTLFQKVQEKKKAEEKEAPRTSRKSPSSKDSGQKLQKTDSERKIDLVEAPRKKGKVAAGKKAGTKAKEKVYEVEDDDIEEFSSSSQGTEGSDEDWEA